MKRIFIRILFTGIILGVIIILISPFQACKKCDTKNSDTIPDTIMAFKPNIYIYPKNNINIKVDVSFPKGGRIVVSIPEYLNNWNVKVDSQGKIDNKYDYLFYESAQPNQWQYNTGWIIEKKKLLIFFQNNMKTYGFDNKEIKDFTDYWIPKLNEYKYYLIYPQEKQNIEKLIQLKFSIKPDNLLRLFYAIKGSNKIEQINEHKINSNFKREDFYITEWGVLKE